MITTSELASDRDPLRRTVNSECRNRHHPNLSAAAVSRTRLARASRLQRRHDVAKIVFGPRGRLSTDLDITLYSQVPRDDIMIALLEAFAQPYRGLRFQLDQSNDWYVADENCGANPLVRTMTIPSACASSCRSVFVSVRSCRSSRQPKSPRSILNCWDSPRLRFRRLLSKKFISRLHRGTSFRFL